MSDMSDTENLRESPGSAEPDQQNSAGGPPGPDSSPVDKKRIALVNGASGQAGRITISGQVVDIPVTAAQKEEDWDPILSVPRSQRRSIKPIQDFGMSNVRRPRLQIQIIKTPADAISHQSLDNAPVLYESEEFTGNDDSFFVKTVEAQLAPGEYVTRVILRGIDSLRQSVADLAYIGDSNSLILKKDIAIGYGKLKILEADYDGFIITSDIDQTFLNTKIDSRRGLVATLFEDTSQKQPILGMAELYRQIQSREEGPIPLYFISASPHFFRRTFSSVFDSLDVPYIGLNLKYLMNTIDSVIRKTFETLTNFEEIFSQGFSHTIERSTKFLSSSLDSIFDHISYKLSVLLENRLMQPTNAREILIGDNTESDYFIFTLYQYLIAGKIREASLEEYLYKLRFLGREALTRDAAKRVRELARANMDRHGPRNSVTQVWINMAVAEPDEHKMAELVHEALPSGNQLGDAGTGDIVPFRGHFGAVGISLAALDAGLINSKQLVAIWNSMEGGKFRDENITDAIFRKVLGGFQFKNYLPDEISKLFTGSGG